MKKRMFLAIAATLVLGLGAASFAYQQTNVTSKTAMSCCCCKGDSCPMKTKDASAGKETPSSCDDCDCCKNGAESCPMKTEASVSAAAMKAGHAGSAVSCPMMKKGEAAVVTAAEVKHEMTAGDGKTCCCPCCSKHKEKHDAPAV